MSDLSTTQPLFPAMQTADQLCAQITDGKLLGLVRDLLSCVGETEHPAGSNRGPFIDAIAKEFGSPLGSPWCALLQGHVRKKNGFWIPTHDVGATNEWVYQAKQAGKWTETPSTGAVIVYGDGTTVPSGRYAGQPHAVHVGCVVAPGKSIEGNTVSDRFDRNGGSCCLKAINTTRVLGYILP